MNRVVTIAQSFFRNVDCGTAPVDCCIKNARRATRKVGLVEWGWCRALGLLGALALGLLVSSAALAASERKPCGIFLDKFLEIGKLAEFKIALRCEADQKDAFPVNEPLLIGLTATTSDNRDNDRVEIEYDFPLQNVVVAPETITVILTFHAQFADISGKSYIYAKAWPRGFLAGCAEGRSGCTKFGYALAMPRSLLQDCTKKDENGGSQLSEDFPCRGSENYRFKFR
jgi:hypothetical protein